MSKQFQCHCYSHRHNSQDCFHTALHSNSTRATSRGAFVCTTCSTLRFQRHWCNMQRILNCRDVKIYCAVLFWKRPIWIDCRISYRENQWSFPESFLQTSCRFIQFFTVEENYHGTPPYGHPFNTRPSRCYDHFITLFCPMFGQSKSSVTYFLYLKNPSKV